MELRSRRPESGRCLTLSAGMASGPLRHAGHVVSAAGGAGRGWGGVPLLGALEAHVAPCEVVRVALQNPTPAVETAQPGREIVTMGLGPLTCGQIQSPSLGCSRSPRSYLLKLTVAAVLPPYDCGR